MQFSILDFSLKAISLVTTAIPPAFIYAFITSAIFSHVILREVGGIK